MKREVLLNKKVSKKPANHTDFSSKEKHFFVLYFN
ncbi:unknown [[Mannheimia] succiniciproducens MBEL55E]|uniref:Uncharacterized protein n=1 Tax=Mannheimia succiniciproducens (strain KCTC 0769BP / MBEL55E) TaxID=221988 RepID=Q65UC3_MANSM|nr:unknown [[Mannheimia] succiniciproducens MBEL55E]